MDKEIIEKTKKTAALYFSNVKGETPFKLWQSFDKDLARDMSIFITGNLDIALPLLSQSWESFPFNQFDSLSRAPRLTQPTTETTSHVNIGLVNGDLKLDGAILAALPTDATSITLVVVNDSYIMRLEQEVSKPIVEAPPHGQAYRIITVADATNKGTAKLARSVNHHTMHQPSFVPFDQPFLCLIS